MALAAAAGSTLVLPVAVRLVIDRGFSPHQRAHRPLFPRPAGGATLIGRGLGHALLHGHLDRRARRGRCAPPRAIGHILSLSPAFFEHTRTGEVLSRLTADTTLVQSIVGSSASFALRSMVMALGALVMMAVTSLEADGTGLRRRAADAGADHHDGPARARPVARVAGPHRRDLGAGRRDHRRDADGAGLHARGGGSRAASARPPRAASRTGLRRTRMRALMIAAGLHAGRRLHRRRAVDRRAGRAGRTHDGRTSSSQFVIYAVLLASFGRRAERTVGRGAARGRRHRTTDGNPATEPAIRAPAQPRRWRQPVRGRRCTSTPCASAIRRGRITRRSTA